MILDPQEDNKRAHALVSLSSVASASGMLRCKVGSYELAFFSEDEARGARMPLHMRDRPRHAWFVMSIDRCRPSSDTRYHTVQNTGMSTLYTTDVFKTESVIGRLPPVSWPGIVRV